MAYDAYRVNALALTALDGLSNEAHDSHHPIALMLPYEEQKWGESTVSASWDDSYYSRELALDVLGKIVSELGAGLKVGQFQCRKTTGQLPCNDQDNGRFTDV